jgi:predicted nucleotide-binding protein
MTFERPTKGDLDRTLSTLMHDHRHKLMEQCALINSDAVKAGALQSNRVVVVGIKAADDVHKEAMTQANSILLDYIGRMDRSSTEIVGWARPHLENLGNSLLGVVKPNNCPEDYQRLTQQYRVVFQQRLDGVLRDVEVGFVKGAGFARADQMESKEQWLTAAEAVRLLKPVFGGEFTAKKTICKRAHNGLIRARAEHFANEGKAADNQDVPKEFWWAEGGEALAQNWVTGDFETWIRHQIHLRAFGVSFLRSDIEKMIPATVAEQPSPKEKKMPSTGKTVFIGHGGSKEWLVLKDFLRERLHLSVEEFNSVSIAGIPTPIRLEEMLDRAAFAFLVMTAEDEQPDGTFRPRENVVHEAGLFQGRLGFKKAIILLEEGCTEFSNIHGLGQIRFPKGNVRAKLEEIRQVLERENIVAAP